MGRSEASREAFPHHSGGVLHVEYQARYGIVPEALLEDDRLDLDSRGAAAWLAIKPPGWQISVSALRRRLSLGKDRWQRIASELEAAGYLVRQKANGPGGQWIWKIIFNPEPKTIAGFPADGQAASGIAAGGPSATGHHGYKELPTEELPFQGTTTTAVENSGGYAQEKRGGGEMYNDLVFEPTISAMKAPLVSVLVKQKVVDLALCQDLLDELTGVLDAGKRGERQTIKLPSAWFQRLAIKAMQGDFERMHCRVIQRRRLSATTAQQKPGDAHHSFEPSAAGMQTLTALKAILRSQRT